MRALSPIELQEGMTPCQYYCEHLIKATMLNEDTVKSTAWYYKHTKVPHSICRPVFSFTDHREQIHQTNASLWKFI